MLDVDDLLRIVLEIHPPDILYGQQPYICSREADVYGQQPYILPQSSLKTRADFWRYQDLLVTLIKQCVIASPDKLPGLLAALEPGAGKTAVVLTAIRELIDEGHLKKALITAPVLVAQTTWPEEITEWQHLRHTTHTLIRVEDDDAEMQEIGDSVYAEALARHQAAFAADVAEKSRLNPSKASALAIVRAAWEAKANPDPAAKKVKSTPGDFAERERQAAVAKAKDAKLGRLAAEDTEIHIINKEALPWIWAHFRNGRDWPYEIVVGDDLREFRSGKRRSKKVGAKVATKADPLSRWGVLAAARKHIKAMLEFTGTPTPKGLNNLWAAIYLIDQGERLGAAKKAFDMRWFYKPPYGFGIEPKDHAFAEIMGLIRDIMFSVDPKDLAELPPFILDPIRVRLPLKVLREYKHFERKLVSEEYDVEAVNAGVLHGKLLQFANGSMYQESGDDIAIHDLKIEALKALVERLDGTPLLVAYTYRFDVERICKAFPNAVVMTPNNAVQFKKDWNDDKIVLGLAHRASAGHGLNMQKGSGHMCEYGLTTDAELFYQFTKRLHRPGRLSPVYNHVIIAEGTIDEDVYPMYLDPKMETQNQILAAVRLSFNT